MIKVLIVDDEPFIRQGLSLLIKWKEHGCEVIGEASNGNEAMDIIKNKSVDLVITDIKMPEMNGLELIKSAKDNGYNNIKFIVLSGFYEFEYAKTAIKYGVKDYVLKPIQKEELNHVLDEFKKDFIKEKSNLKEIEKAKNDIYEMKLNKLILGKADSNTIKLLEEKLEPSNYLRFVLIDIDMRNMTNDEKKQCRLNTYSDIIKIIGSKQYNMISELDDKKNMYSIGFIYDKKFLEDDMFGERGYIENLACKLRKTVNNTFYVYVGKAITHIEDIKKSYETATMLKIIDWSSKIIFFEEIYKDSCRKHIVKKEYMDTLVNGIEENNNEKIRECIKGFYESFKGGYIEGEILKINIDYLLFNLINIEKDINEESNKEELLELIGLLDVENIISRDSSKNLESFSVNFAEYLESLRKNSNKGVLSYIDKEIYDHYMEKLSLKSLSEKYYLNSAYLGQIFKKKYKISVKDYLNEFRIEKAAEMLKRSDEKVYEIAAKVGYSNNDYFINKFTQIKGKTPFRYRKDFMDKEESI